MTDFNLDTFIQAARDAAVSDAPTKATLSLMKSTFANPDDVARHIGSFDKDDEVLFEDSTVSVWHVRFKPGILVPPHDHQMPAFIGVYEGTEVNRLYRKDEDGLTEVTRKHIGPGDTLPIGPNGIHAVQALNDVPSQAIHVYLGKLTTVERSLFDWETGEAMAFTDENYEAMVRSV